MRNLFKKKDTVSTVEIQKNKNRQLWKGAMPFNEKDIESLEMNFIIDNDFDKLILSEWKAKNEWTDGLVYDDKIIFESYKQYTQFVHTSRAYSLPVLKEMQLVTTLQ